MILTIFIYFFIFLPTHSKVDHMALSAAVNPSVISVPIGVLCILALLVYVWQWQRTGVWKLLSVDVFWWHWYGLFCQSIIILIIVIIIVYRWFLSNKSNQCGGSEYLCYVASVRHFMCGDDDWIAKHCQSSRHTGSHFSQLCRRFRSQSNENNIRFVIFGDKQERLILNITIDMW